MARYIGPNCRLCRREGTKLFLKGERCTSDRCSFERRGYAPGQHGQSMTRKRSEYEQQLREKQKAKRIYGVLERQFRNYFKKAERMKGIAGENLIRFLECRLDSLVFRLGFAPSRKAARQLIRHRHFLVNDQIVDIPSYQVSPGDVIKVREKSRKLEGIHDSLAKMGKGKELPWLSVDKVNLTGTLLQAPKRDEIPVPVEERLIVELYSR